MSYSKALSNAELRAAPVPVDVSASNPPVGSASEVTLAQVLDALNDIFVLLGTPVDSLPHLNTDDTIDLQRTKITRATSGQVLLVAAAGAGQTTRVQRVRFTTNGPCTIELLSGLSGAVLDDWVIPANAACAAYDSYFDARPFSGITAANTALYFKLTGNVQVDFTVWTQSSVPV